jgi:hypothetical protein
MTTAENGTIWLPDADGKHLYCAAFRDLRRPWVGRSLARRARPAARPCIGGSRSVEIIEHVALNVFTNYINEALKTEIDHPAVSFRKAS